MKSVKPKSVRGRKNDTVREEPGSSSTLGEQFTDLYAEVKSLMKHGSIRKLTLEKAKALHVFLEKNAPALRAEYEFFYLKSRCMTAEIFDQFGLTGEAKEASREGAEILKQVPLALDSSGRVTKDREILREKIRLCVDYAQVYFYRAHLYPGARDIIVHCRNFVEHSLQNEDFPCYGTLGQIYYLLGKIYRQENDYKAAEECFSLAIENYFRRSQLNTKQSREDLALATLKSGICLALGIGWVNYVRGHLRRALHDNINPARILLLHASDELSSAYLDLVHSSILRALSKKGGEDLGKAIKLAQRSYEVFRDNEHRRYMARAAWELGLAYFSDGRLEEAERKVQEVEAVSEEAEDHRWICNCLVLRSRIERERGKNLRGPERDKQLIEAKDLAARALGVASQYRQKLCEIDSLIARSEVSIETGENDAARDDLNRALELNKEFGTDPTSYTSNPKTDALCYLYLARSYARDRKVHPARVYLQRWKELEKEVEHEYIRELADDVDREIKEALKKAFVIEGGPELELDYKKHQRTLQEFLIKQAKLRANEKQKVADMLGISRQTLFEWERELKL